MVIAADKISKQEAKKAWALLKEIEKAIEKKKKKGYNPTAVLVSVQYYALLMSAFGSLPASPVRSDVMYSSCYGLRLVLLPFVHETFIEVVCGDEPQGDEKNG